MKNIIYIGWNLLLTSLLNRLVLKWCIHWLTSIHCWSCHCWLAWHSGSVLSLHIVALRSLSWHTNRSLTYWTIYNRLVLTWNLWLRLEAWLKNLLLRHTNCLIVWNLSLLHIYINNICFLNSNLFCNSNLFLLNLRWSKNHTFDFLFALLVCIITSTNAAAKNDNRDDACGRWWNIWVGYNLSSEYLVIFDLITTCPDIHICSYTPFQFPVIEASWIVCFYPAKVYEPFVSILFISMHNGLAFIS